MRMIIPFLAFCLVATCNAELRTWTAVNGKEVEAEFVSNEKGVVKLKLKSGKVFEVPADKLSKEDNEFISSLVKPEGVNGDELEEREGIMYLNGSDTPYTGKVFRLYKNGQKSGEINYKDGKQDGLETDWEKNGQKTIEKNWKDGKPDGLWLRWHDNGQKNEEVNWKDGKLISRKYWNSKGEPVDFGGNKLKQNNP
jgi:antitoxin component YwqK of YwqJK toxin-antitoxin module